MVNKRQLTTFIILLSIVLLSSWFVLSTKVTQIKQNKPQDPDAFMIETSATQMSKLGNPANVLTATKLVNYTQNNTTIFQNPFIIHYVDNAPPWHISANHGTAIKGTEIITLENNVKIHQLPGPSSHNATLLTDKLTYYSKTSFAETDKPVTIIQPGGVLHAVGMQADLNKGYVKFLSKVQGQYDKNTTK